MDKVKFFKIEHRDGDEYIFYCPKCSNKVSTVSWKNIAECYNCNTAYKVRVEHLMFVEPLEKV